MGVSVVVWGGEGVDVAGFFQGFDGGDVLEDVPTQPPQSQLQRGRGEGEWWGGVHDVPD